MHNLSLLFIMAMNLIISAASTKARGPTTAPGCQQPEIREFTDDLTAISPTQVQARWVLAELDRMATWAKMVFKAKKLLVQGEVIPNIQGNPVKCLGKWCDDSLSDKTSITNTRNQMEECINVYYDIPYIIYHII